MNSTSQGWKLLATACLALAGCTTGARAGQPSGAAMDPTCPVSLPNVTESPYEHFAPSGLAIQNAAGTIFTTPWPNGEVVFEPEGPGTINPDGSMSMKWPWYRTVPGEIEIGGRRLDGSSPPMPSEILHGPPDGYGETGFHPGILTFPTEGCWEVTARIGDATLTFVTRITLQTE